MSLGLTKSPLFKVHLAGVGAVVGLFAIAGVLMVLPMSDTARKRASLESGLADKTEQLDSLKNQRVRFEREFARISARLGNESGLHEDGATLTDRMLALTEAATAAGLTVLGTDTDEAINREHYTVQPLELLGRGSYAEATVFLGELLDAFSDIRVVEVELRSAAGGASEASFRFGLAWYVGSAGAAEG